MFQQFTDLYGNPVFVRPERVEAVRGIAVTWNGQPRPGTLIVMESRETFRVRGLAEGIAAEIGKGVVPKWMLPPLEPSAQFCADVNDCLHRPSANWFNRETGEVADSTLINRQFEAVTGEAC